MASIQIQLSGIAQIVFHTLQATILFSRKDFRMYGSAKSRLKRITGLRKK